MTILTNPIEPDQLQLRRVERWKRERLIEQPRQAGALDEDRLATRPPHEEPEIVGRSRRAPQNRQHPGGRQVAEVVDRIHALERQGGGGRPDEGVDLSLELEECCLVLSPAPGEPGRGRRVWSGRAVKAAPYRPHIDETDAGARPVQEGEGHIAVIEPARFGAGGGAAQSVERTVADHFRVPAREHRVEVAREGVGRAGGAEAPVGQEVA
jgi:hypothetical protein